MWYAPHARDAYGKEEIKAVENALINGWLTTGPITGKFENEIASLYGKKHGLFVNSGSSANLIALEIMDFPAGSEIITPACTFNTTVSPIIQKGLFRFLLMLNRDIILLTQKACGRPFFKNSCSNGPAFDRQPCGSY